MDLLFVVDNSYSMADEQERLRSQFPLLVQELRDANGGLPDLHLGVTTTDLGAGMFQIPGCMEVGGDGGILVTGQCANPVGGANYLIDVQPQGCEIDRDEVSSTCLSHGCDQSHCAHEPTTVFELDHETGCPRCRNYAHEPLEEVFSCMAAVGTLGCGFEQPLEAMARALDPSNAANQGFLREDAYLGVVLLTDEDDCSAATPVLFDTTQTGIDTALGPLSSFRCFEHGITCDIDERLHQGERHECLPRGDAAALLHPLSRYIQFLQSLKDPSRFVISAIAGPVQPSSTGVGYDVTIGRDESDWPALEPSCTTPEGGAVPAVRIHSLVSAFNPPPQAQDWAYLSVCADSYADTLTGLGREIADAVGLDCLPAPLKGCADPGVEFARPQAEQTCDVNSRCLAQCSVTTLYRRGLPDEAEFEVPPCLEVCADGPCPGNLDRARAHAAGHPAAYDPALPVLSCWHVAYDERCTDSNGAHVVIARRFVLPPRSYTNIACVQIPQVEQLCNDLQDNDEDCLVDMDDPDCRGY